MHIAEKETIQTLYDNDGQTKKDKINLPLNERLRIARNATRMTSAGVVKELKKQGYSIGHSTLQGYEADEKSANHRYPSIQNLITLSDFYGCSMDFLFGLTDKIERPKSKKKIILKAEPMDLKESLYDPNEPIYWEGKRFTDRQKKLVKAQIEFILNRTDKSI
jgi:transcriptional regulator with XRE-family HTH domain